MSKLVRLISLFLRFIQVFLVGRFLPPEKFSVYILFVSLSAFFIIVNGFDVTRFLQKEYKYLGTNRRIDNIKVSTYWLGLYYLLFFVVCCVSSYYFNLDFLLAFLFFVFVFVEHIAQELGRFAMYFGKQMVFTIGNFLRTGLPVLMIAVYVFSLGDSNLLLFIIFSLIFSSLIGAFYLAREQNVFKLVKTKAFNRKIESGQRFGWLIKALKFSIPLFVSTMSVKAVFVVDKVLLNELVTDEILGFYSLGISAGLVIITLLELLLISYYIPLCYQLRDDLVSLKESYKAYLFRSVCLVIPLYVLGVLFFYEVYPYLYTALYQPSLFQVFIVVSLPATLALSNVPKQTLIVLEDRFFIMYVSFVWFAGQALAFWLPSEFNLKLVSAVVVAFLFLGALLIRAYFLTSNKIPLFSEK
jgi:O-antigen/teichoic acid export membrane protein